MVRSPRKAGVALLAATVVAVLLSACSVKLVSDYDPQIDAGLGQLNTDLIAFVKKMNSVAGTEAGTWKANQDFYIDQEARVDTLIVRAEAHKVLDSCPSTKAIAAAVQSAAPGTDAASLAGKIPEGDCSVTLLTLIKGGYGDLETFHKAQGAAGIPASADDPILVGGLGSLLRSAITVELSKKSSMTAQP